MFLELWKQWGNENKLFKILNVEIITLHKWYIQCIEPITIVWYSDNYGDALSQGSV